MSRGASRNPEEDTFPRGTRGKRAGFGIQPTWVQSPALPLARCVAEGPWRRGRAPGVAVPFLPSPAPLSTELKARGHWQIAGTREASLEEVGSAEAPRKPGEAECRITQLLSFSRGHLRVAVQGDRRLPHQAASKNSLPISLPALAHVLGFLLALALPWQRSADGSISVQGFWRPRPAGPETWGEAGDRLRAASPWAWRVQPEWPMGLPAASACNRQAGRGAGRRGGPPPRC